MNLPRREVLYLATAAAALLAVPQTARTQAYPARPVRWIVGFPAGGTTDLVARLIGQWLSERSGQSFVIENRPGAATNLATEAVVAAPADGYTLLHVTTSNAINATLYQKLNYNFLQDITMIAGLIRSPLVLEVHPTVPVNTVPELIAYAKANPGKLSMASFGTGTISHMAAELFKMVTGVDTLHVPYRGSAPMLVDLLGGQVHVAFDNLPASIQHIRSGKLRPLAVTTTMRSQVLPELPTVGEFLLGYEADAWSAVGAPKNTPAEIVETLNKEINMGLANSRIKARLADLGAAPLFGSAADFSKYVAEETEKWGKVIRAANLKAD
jgi:tripartite-type tricarboxylate transporter receptor subunit TctC